MFHISIRARLSRCAVILVSWITASLGCANFVRAATITNADDVLALSANEAAEARPVALRAVVISESEPRERALVVADQSGGVYLLAKTNIFAPYHRGDLLELTGVTDPGEFAPIVIVSSARRLGSAPLPAPRPATYHQIITGSLDAQWVEFSGIVQQFLPAAPGSQMRRMVVSVDGGLVHVRMLDPRDPNIQEDAEVRVRALCFYQFNQKRQLLNPVLQVPSGLPVTVIKPAPSDPFAAPLRRAASLLVFSHKNVFGHRVHVRGIVTHSEPGSSVWIRDESSGLRLQTRISEPLQPGDVIDVLGFPKLGSATPNLDDAIYQKLGTTSAPAPLHLSQATNAFDYGDDLISLEANLTEVIRTPQELDLSLESSGVAFKATLTLPADAGLRPDWQPDSVVRIQGICSIDYDDPRPIMGIWRPKSFQLLLRSPGDVTVLRTPPWWTLKHITLLLGMSLGATLLITGVVMLKARRHLREQAHQRAMAETEFAAILSERNRVAREIHDTLAQGLTATSVQLRLARKHTNGTNEAVARHLDAAQELVQASLEDARGTIWNMRSQILETGDLQTALSNILRKMAEGADVKTNITVTGRPRRFAPFIENDLLRVGQEAITNAAKHARAKTIAVSLEFEEKRFRLSVKDDGCGFDPAKPPPSEGGFGLVGMQERAQELKAHLDIRSAPQSGAEIILDLPLSSE